MKKKFCIVFISIISVLCLAFSLSACAGKVEFKVSFVVDGQTVHTINTNGNEVIAMPPDPQKDDYIFDGWYWDKDVWEKPFTANSLLDAPLSSNMNVYCKWRPEHEHVFTQEAVEDKYKVSGASCTEKSKYYYSCVCGETGAETFEYGELLQHTEETITGKVATCTESGLTDGKKCSVCGKVLVEQTTIPVLEHTEETITGKAATCTETGLTDGKKCSICGEVLQEQTTIPVIAHSEETIVGKPASCSEDGLTDGKKCSVCKVVLVEQETIPAAHIPTAWIVDKNSTCTEKGSKHKECVVCGSALTTEEIAIVPHTETTIYGKVPTCTDSGLTNGRICSVCGTTTAEQTVIPATGHKFDNGVCLSCGIEESPATISEVKGGTINDLDIYMFVEHDVTEVNLLRIVTCSPKSTWKLYEDKRGQHEIATKIASGENDELNNGNNVFYIVATSANGIDVNTYTITIYRSYAITVKYYNGSALERTDNVYTGYDYAVGYEPEYRGYTFNGWKNGDETFTNAVLWDNLVLIADKTVHTFTVSFVTDSKAQAIDGFTVAYDQEVTLPASRKTGYTFNGWLDGNEISENTFVWNFIEDKQYTAKFTANEYTITYIPNGGTLASTTQTVTYDSEYTLYDVSRTGYTFTGWYCGDERGVGGIWQKLTDYIFTAQWQANSYTVTFDANGGTCETTTTDYVFDNNQTLPAINRVGYTFMGWYYSEQKISNGAWKIADNCTLTAKWVANTDTLYTVMHIGQNITDDEFGIELLAENLHGTSDDNVTPAVKSYTGFTSPQEEEITIAPDGSAILIYYYTRNSYALTLCANNGMSNTTQIAKYEAQIASVERQDYTFGGWFTNVTLTQSVVSMPANDLTVYAWWQEENKASDFTYTTQETVAITGYKGTSNTVVIPSYIGGVVVTEIGDSAFKDKSTLTSVTISDNIASIGEGVFDGCSNLKTVYWNAINCTKAGGFSACPIFQNCSKLTTIEIRDNVASIPSWAFKGCSGLKSIEIPSSVTSIGSGVFDNCSSLTSITYNGDIASWCEIEISGSLMEASNRALIIDGNSIKGNLVIPDSVMSIGNCAFYDCRSITSVTISDSVTSIGINAFRGCSGLKSIEIPNSVTSIGSWAFEDCSSLTNVTICNGIMSIGYSAFDGCSSLTSIEIPDSVTSIGDNVFTDCSGLRTVTIGNGITSIGINAFKGCSSLISITIPDNVTSIGSRAFYGCTGLKSVTIGSMVTSIGSNAFDSCGGLTSIVIPDSVTSIGKMAFEKCISLIDVTIGNGVTSIGEQAFAGCSWLLNVTIGNSVTSIGLAAFYNCSDLKNVYYKGTQDEWNSISIDKNNNYNSKLTSATRYYYSESEPTVSGNYWHYDTDGVTPVKW